MDTSPFECAAACASLGLPIAFLPGDKVDVKRCGGRVLELQEEAVVLGTYQGRLFYRLISQKSEGGSLMEGGGRSWFWDESEAVDGGLQLIGEGLGLSITLPKLNRFNPTHSGLKVVYEGGAVGALLGLVQTIIVSNIISNVSLCSNAQSGPIWKFLTDPSQWVPFLVEHLYHHIK